MEKKNKTTPLKVVRRESGYLLFSDSNTGKEGKYSINSPFHSKNVMLLL